jgi:hypothetical protein
MADRKAESSKRLIEDVRGKYREQAKICETPFEKAKRRWKWARYTHLLGFAMIASLVCLALLPNKGYGGYWFFIGLGSAIGLNWFHRKSYLQLKILNGVSEADAKDAYNDKYVGS